jgi:hypothetical protein
METTFKKEIKFISPTLKDKEGGAPEWVKEPVTKTATFKELSRTDRDQREMCWLIMEILDFSKYKKGKKTTKIPLDRVVASELTDTFIEEMLVLDEVFTEADKKDFINDNGAVINFGLWLAAEKILPFFLTLTNG